MNRLSRRSTVIVVAVLLAVGGGTAAGVAASTGGNAPKVCRTLSGLTNASQQSVHQFAPPSLNAGDTIIDHDVVTDSTGRRVGTATNAIMVYTDTSTGKPSESLAAWGSFTDGSFYGHAFVTVAQAQANAPVDVPVVGTSGKYLGSSGTYRLQLHQTAVSTLIQVASSLTLCG